MTGQWLIERPVRSKRDCSNCSIRNRLTATFLPLLPPFPALALWLPMTVEQPTDRSTAIYGAEGFTALVVALLNRQAAEQRDIWLPAAQKKSSCAARTQGSCMSCVSSSTDCSRPDGIVRAKPRASAMACARTACATLIPLGYGYPAGPCHATHHPSAATIGGIRPSTPSSRSSARANCSTPRSSP